MPKQRSRSKKSSTSLVPLEAFAQLPNVFHSSLACAHAVAPLALHYVIVTSIHSSGIRSFTIFVGTVNSPS